MHKSLGDVTHGTAMFERYSEVDREMTALRAIVMARKEPRKLLVQPHLAFEEGKATLTSFAATPVGMIESFVARFPAEDPELLALAAADQPHVAD